MNGPVPLAQWIVVPTGGGLAPDTSISWSYQQPVPEASLLGRNYPSSLVAAEVDQTGTMKFYIFVK